MGYCHSICSMGFSCTPLKILSLYHFVLNFFVIYCLQCFFLVFIIIIISSINCFSCWWRSEDPRAEETDILIQEVPLAVALRSFFIVIPIHYLMLSDQFLRCYLCLHPPTTMPCVMVL